MKHNTRSIVLNGTSASAGVASGRARVILPHHDLRTFEEGEILVTTLTDPTMIHAMIKAIAIVTDIGGITSHPAIISREMGIPCVVNTKYATQRITDGMLLEVDGTKGIVYVLD